MQTQRKNLGSDFTLNLGSVFSRKHHATFLSDLDFIEHFLLWKMFYQEKCFSSTKMCVCVIQNVVSFTSPALPHFPSTPRTSSVRQDGSCHPEHTREESSETIQCEKHGKRKVFQILHFNNVSGSKSLFEVLISVAKLMFSLLGGSFEPSCGVQDAEAAHPTWPIAPYSNTDLMLWRHQGKGEPISVYCALSQTVHWTVLFSLKCKLVLTKEHCMTT